MHTTIFSIPHQVACLYDYRGDKIKKLIFCFHPKCREIQLFAWSVEDMEYKSKN
jgi:hypothetical protein